MKPFQRHNERDICGADEAFVCKPRRLDPGTVRLQRSFYKMNVFLRLRNVRLDSIRETNGSGCRVRANWLKPLAYDPWISKRPEGSCWIKQKRVMDRER